MAEKEMNTTILQTIQAELKVPKNRYNKFGEFYYRSCEDILESVKPLLKKFGATLIMSDKIEQVGDRIYVKSTASIFTENEINSSDGFAREPLIRKKMDDAQVTSMSSSYARKLALEGLLALSDGVPTKPERLDKKPNLKSSDIINRAFKEFGQKHKTYLNDNPSTKVDMVKFAGAIKKKYGRYPTNPESIKKIIKEINLSDVISGKFEA